MAAIAYPTTVPTMPDEIRSLRLVPSPGTARALPHAVYARRRAAVLALLVGLVLAAVWCAAALRPATTEARTTGGTTSAPLVHDLSAYGASHESPPANARYVVQPGDTLWSIAHRLAPEGDVRGEVDRLQHWNGTAALQAGQRLLVGPPSGG